MMIKFPGRALLAPLALAIAGQSHGFEFNLGNLTAQFDTTLSAGIGIRMSDPNPDFISQGNLGPEFAFSDTGASSNNFDDGNLNFKKGRPYSKILRGRSELFLDYPTAGDTLTRVGAMTRVTYYYDYELRNNRRARDPVGQRRELNPEARSNAAGIDLLDAYVFSDWWLGEQPLNLRYGRQVVNWGESTFILGGINATNPVDVPAFRRPGAEVKDVLLPVEMLYGSLGLTTNLTLEAYVQTRWEPFRIDDCGTFFSTADVAADGCGPVLLAGQVPDSQALEDGLVAERMGDREPGDRDQFGVALRWFVPAIDSEVGFYYLRYHSRLPYISGQVNNPEDGNSIDNVDFNPDLEEARFPQYFVDYPKGINLFGASINGYLPTGTSIGAEYSYRPNLPIQWNTFELIFGGLQQRGPNGEILSLLEQQLRDSNPDTNFAGQIVDGWDRHKVSQAQTTLIHFIDRIWNADRLILVGEVGATYVHDLPSLSEARYGRTGTFGIGPLDVAGDDFTGDFCQAGPDGEPGANINPTNCVNDGYVTSFSWGYRALMALDYSNAIWGINLMPQVFFSHDVKGYAPQPGGNFMEGSKSISLGLNGDYQNRWSGTISYTNFFDGKPFNEMSDRDFLAASISYSF